MSERRPQTIATDDLQTSELELDLRERELSAAERALDARWLGHEHRQKVLQELREYVADREITLRARANRLGLRPSDVDTLIPAEEPPALAGQADMTEVALGLERGALIEDRAALCERRSEALENRQAMLAEGERIHSTLEEGLIGREQQLATAFRRMVERAGQLASVPAPSPGVTQSMPEPTAEELRAEENRRRFHRIELSARVDFGTAHNFFSAHTENLSIGGVFVATGNLLMEGRRVHVRLALPDEGNFDVEGEVAWRRLVKTAEGLPGLGIRFVDLGPEAAAAIDRFVKKRAPIVHG